MLRKGSLIIIFIIMNLSMGCILQGPDNNPSFSMLPELLLDYDFDADETDIWVKSALSDFKYENISIEVDYENIYKKEEDNKTYCVHLSTKLMVFNLNIIVNSLEKTFTYQGTIDIDLMREDLIIITTYDEITDEPTEEILSEDDLPYKIILKEFKGEE
jgi:hypothetical protein